MITPQFFSPLLGGGGCGPLDSPPAAAGAWISWARAAAVTAWASETAPPAGARSAWPSRAARATCRSSRERPCPQLILESLATHIALIVENMVLSNESVSALSSWARVHTIKSAEADAAGDATRRWRKLMTIVTVT